MGQLTNLYVSSSYQGLLKLTDSTTGLTATLQPVQDGLGGDSPLQISKTEVNISGSLTINGSPVTNVNTGSFVTTSSFNSFTSSIDNRVDGLEAQTSSYITNSQTSSMSVASSSYSNYAVSSSEATHAVSASYAPSSPLPSGVVSGSAQIIDLGFATTSSVSSSIASLSGSIATTDLGQNNRLTSIESKTGSYATTGSNNFVGQQNINGSVNVTGSVNITGNISATSASFTYVNTVYETASVIYSSGSNQFGDASNDTQTLWGTVNLPSGPLVVTGSVTSTGGFNGNLTGTASYATTASYALNAGTASFVNSAVTSSIAYDLVVYGKCDNPGGLTKGTIVRITGANGDNPLFNSASWTNDPTSANTLGMLTENVAYNGFANIVTQGTVIGINTNGMTAGDMLYLSSSGQYTTSSVPAPYHEVRLGQVLRPQLNNGSVYISIDNGYELTELHDVDITSVAVGDVLTYVSGSYGQWVNKTVGELGYLETSSFNSYTSSMDARTGSYITTGSASSVQSITGSLNVSGSLNVNGPVTLLPGGGTPTTPGLLLGGNTSNKLFVSGANNDVYLRSINDIILTVGNNGNLKISGPGGSTPISSSIVGNTQITGSLILSGSAGAELDVKGDQNVTGSINISGSMNINGKIVNDAVNKGLFIVSSTDVYPAPYAHITSSNDNANIIFPPLTQNGTATGSMFISGSNNILLLGGSQLGASGRRNIVGSQNIIGSHFTVNTSSLTIPNLQANIFLGAVSATLTTGSNAGNNAHNFATNINTNTITWNHPSASIGAGNSSTISSNVNVGVVTSTTTGPTILTAASTFTNNLNSNNSLALNNISSSIQSTYNVIAGNGLTFNNRYFTTGSNNFLANSANIFAGQGVVVNTAGAPASNVSRTLVGNIIGGQTVNVSLEANNLDTAGLRNSIVYGQGLNVSGSHSAASTAQNSITLVGRWNGEDNGLADSARTVFAVGTGTATGTRRTGLYVTSGSLVGVSGSLDVKGNSTFTGSLLTSGSSNLVGNMTVTGSVASTKSFAQVILASNQTVTSTADTTVNFDTTDFDPNSWWNSSTKVFTPTIAGYYEFTAELLVGTGTGTGQMNVQLNKNSGTQTFIYQSEINVNQPQTLGFSKILFMNGSTDNVKITFYTSSGSGSQDVQGGNGTLFNVKLL